MSTRSAAVIERTHQALHRSGQLQTWAQQLQATASLLRDDTAKLRRRLFVRSIHGGSSNMVDDEAIKAKLASGLLPKVPPQTTWYGHGAGKACAACELPVGEHHIEVKADFDGAPTLRFHAGCFEVWKLERSRVA